MSSPDATRTSPPPQDPGDLTRSAPDPATHSVDPLATADGPVVAAFGETPVVPGFDIMEEVGRGGMGVVFKARHVKLNRTVALKMVLTADARAAIRFLAEAEAAAAVRHPHVVQVFDFGEVAGRPFLAMEFLDGGDLADKLKATRLAPADAAALVGKVAHGVAAAHALGIVHRDIKPGNVLFDSSGSPKVVDFGLAKRGGSSDLTRTHAMMGTPAYMAPEQAKGAKFAGPPADVWALGVILYECLTGARPFDGDDVQEILNRVLNDDPRSLRSRDTAVPRDLDLIVRKCLAKEPHERYATASELAEELDRFTRGEPVRVRPAGVAERAYKWAKRKPALAGLYVACLAAVLLVGVTIAVGRLWLQAERERKWSDKTRGDLATEKRVAESARREAEEALGRLTVEQAATARARDDLAEARDSLARIEYGRAVQAAHQEWRENNLSASLDLLHATRRDLRGWEWRYVHRLQNAERLTLPGKGGVVTAAFNGDGTRILTAGRNVQLWDAATGAEVLAFKGQCGALSPDGSRVATGFFDGSAAVWDAKTAERVQTLKGHKEPVAWVTYSPDGTRIATGSTDGAKVWDAATGGEVLALRHGHRPAAFSPDGARIATFGNDGVKVWDAKTGDLRLTLTGHKGYAGSVAFSRNGGRIITAGTEGMVKVWDSETGAGLVTIAGHADWVRAAAFSPDGSQIVSAGNDRTVRVWNAANGAELLRFRGTSPFTTAAFSPDGKRVVTASSDAARVWDATVAADCRVLPEHIREVISVAFTADGSRVVTVCGGVGLATSWDAKTWTRTAALDWTGLGNDGAAAGMAISPDGSRVVCGGWSEPTNRCILRDATGREVAELKGHTDRITAAAFSRDGTRVVTTSDDKTARVWDATSGAEVCRLKGQGGGGAAAAFSPDGTRVVTAGAAHTARVWDAATGAELLTLNGHDADVRAAAFSPDGARIVTASADMTAKVWDAKTGAEFVTLRGHTSAVWAAAFSPDGARAVTGSYDRTAKLWEPRSGAEVLTLKGHTQGVTSAAFSPDGARIVTGSLDSSARIWDATPVDLPPAAPVAAPPPRVKP